MAKGREFLLTTLNSPRGPRLPEWNPHTQSFCTRFEFKPSKCLWGSCCKGGRGMAEEQLFQCPGTDSATANVVMFLEPWFEPNEMKLHGGKKKKSYSARECYHIFKKQLWKFFWQVVQPFPSPRQSIRQVQQQPADGISEEFLSTQEGTWLGDFWGAQRADSAPLFWEPLWRQCYTFLYS